MQVSVQNVYAYGYKKKYMWLGQFRMFMPMATKKYMWRGQFRMFMPMATKKYMWLGQSKPKHKPLRRFKVEAV